MGFKKTARGSHSPNTCENLAPSHWLLPLDFKDLDCSWTPHFHYNEHKRLLLSLVEGEHKAKHRNAREISPLLLL